MLGLEGQIWMLKQIIWVVKSISYIIGAIDIRDKLQHLLYYFWYKLGVEEQVGIC